MPAAVIQRALICPLCHASETVEFHQDQCRDYLKCSNCHLVFVPPQQFISKEEEKAQYDSHNNSPENMDYRKFLGRLFNPMNERLKKESSGLDFGSGPGPTLSVMFQEIGHKVALYDPNYARNASVFDQKYDFVTASEVIEHLSDPQGELDRLWQCIKPDGFLGVMTKLVIDQAAFAKWHYKNEPTHICFYSKDTFQWLADHWNAELQFYGQDVMIFQKGLKP